MSLSLHPSGRLAEVYLRSASGSGHPIISSWWAGLEGVQPI